MTIEYLVDGVEFSSLDGAVDDVVTNHDFDTDGIADIIISDTFEDTTQVDIDGMTGTVDADAYVRIRATGSARSSSQWDASAYRLRVSSGNAAVIHVDEPYTHIDGIQVEQTGTGSSKEALRFEANADNSLLEKCHFMVQDDSQQDCVHMSDVTLTAIYAADCIFYADGGSSRTCWNHQAWQGTHSQTAHLEHCIFHNAGLINAWHRDGSNSNATYTINVYNCISFGSGSSDYDGDSNASETITGKGCLSGDATSTAAFGSSDGNTNNCDVNDDDVAGTEVLITDSVTEGSYDYQVIDGANAANTAKEAAQTGSTKDSRWDQTTDIAGNSRAGTYTDRWIGPTDPASSGVDGVVVGVVALAGLLAASKTVSNLVTGSLAARGSQDGAKSVSQVAQGRMGVAGQGAAQKAAQSTVRGRLSLRALVDGSITAVVEGAVKGVLALQGALAASKASASIAQGRMATRGLSGGDKAAQGTATGRLSLRAWLAGQAGDAFNAVVRGSISLAGRLGASPAKIAAARGSLALRANDGTSTTRTGTVLGRVSINAANDGAKTVAGVAYNRFALAGRAALSTEAQGTISRVVPLNGSLDSRVALSGIFDPESSLSGTLDTSDLSGEGDPV